MSASDRAAQRRCDSPEPAPPVGGQAPRPRHRPDRRTPILALVCALVGATCLPWGARSLPQRATAETSEADLRRAAELAGQALADLESGNCNSATERLLAVERLLPDNLLPKVNLAICASMLGRRDEALRWLDRARRLAPDNAQALYATARILEPDLDLGGDVLRRWQQALARLEEVAPRDPRAAYLRSRAASDRGDDAEALRQVGRALERSPENLVLLLARLDAAARAGDLDATSDAVDAVEDRLNGFDERAQRFADQLRDAVFAEDAEAARPPALILQNLLRPTDLYQVGRTELLGRGDGSQFFPQLDFDPPLPRSIQGGQDIAVAWIDRSEAWLGASADATAAVIGRSGEGDSVLLLDGARLVLLVGSEGAPTSRRIPLPWATADAPDDLAMVDLDSDGAGDLLAVRGAEISVHRREARAQEGDAPTFTDGVTVSLPGDAEGTGRAAILHVGDVDQEGDLDVLVRTPSGRVAFLRNQGSAGLVPTDLGPLSGTAADAATLVDLDDDGDLDVVVAGPAGVRILDNLRGGSYRDVTSRRLAATPREVRHIVVSDVDGDGRFDLALLQASGATLLRNADDDTLTPETLPLRGAWSALIAADVDNDGDEDLVAGGDGNSLTLLRNRRSEGFVAEATTLEGPTGLRSLLPADLDGDGDLDLLAHGSGGVLTLANDGGHRNQWLRVRLIGRYDNNSKNNVLGHGARVEIRSGGAYQARLSDGTIQHFGLGANRRAEVLRVVWTNGLAQTQQQVSSRQTVVEEQVLKGSCPFLYTWTGDGFEFHTDLLWRSTLGMTFADGSDAPHQSGRDWVLIPGDRLVPVGGRFWLNTTAELWETIYLDRQQLLVVDHPVDAEMVVDEAFRPPPHPTSPPLHWLRHEHLPERAVNHDGRDVREALLRRDEERVDDLVPTRFQGVTEEHSIDLTFGGLPAEGRRTLLLSGWIFPTDTTINVALSQDPGVDVAPPRLEIHGRDGWRTATASPGLPMGKSKTMVVELDDLLTPEERTAESLRLRVSTSMQIYWNRATLSVAPPLERSALPYTVTALDPVLADLHYRGFSAARPRSPSQPHRFDYDRVDVRPRFRDLEGWYSAYGDVRAEVTREDDHYVVMNAGDELTFGYDASDLPDLPPGWIRDYVLYTDGWVKDADVHTRHSQTVEPLPVHGMESYPDPAAGSPTTGHLTRRITGRPFAEALRNPQP